MEFFKNMMAKIKDILRTKLGVSSSHPASMESQSLIKVFDKPTTNTFIGNTKLSAEFYDRTLEQMTSYVLNIFTNELKISCNRNIREDIVDYCRTLSKNPAKDHQQGSTNNGKNIWLFLIARLLEPSVIVESGVFVGRSLYTLKKANPTADLYAFDLDFKHLRYKDENISYHECDWNKVNVNSKGKGDFCYFDDHINNGLRIKEAYNRGFRHLVFDDCPRVGMLHKFKYPGVPTAMMISEDNLETGDFFEWSWDDEVLHYKFEEEDMHGANELIDFAVQFPTLENWIGESSGQLAYVRLKK